MTRNRDSSVLEERYFLPTSLWPTFTDALGTRPVGMLNLSRVTTVNLSTTMGGLRALSTGVSPIEQCYSQYYRIFDKRIKLCSNNTRKCIKSIKRFSNKCLDRSNLPFRIFNHSKKKNNNCPIRGETQRNDDPRSFNFNFFRSTLNLPNL